MSLQFILGNGQKDHRKALIDEAAAWLEKDEDNQVFFLVPNYNKFEQEQELLAEMRKKAEKAHLAQRIYKYSVSIVWLGTYYNKPRC